MSSNYHSWGRLPLAQILTDAGDKLGRAMLYLHRQCPTVSFLATIQNWPFSFQEVAKRERYTKYSLAGTSICGAPSKSNNPIVELLNLP